MAAVGTGKAVLGNSYTRRYKQYTPVETKTDAKLPMSCKTRGDSKHRQQAAQLFNNSRKDSPVRETAPSGYCPIGSPSSCPA